MYEISNAQDQLALLRLIMDNTWVAIQQQANAQQPPKKAKPAIKAKAPAKPVKGPYSPPPKPFPVTNEVTTDPVESNLTIPL